MTPADLRIRREALGVSQTWLAERFGVQDRAVRRWEAGDSPIPAALDDLLDELETTTDAWLDAAITAIEDGVGRLATEHGEPEQITLTAYATDTALTAAHPDMPWPASWHRARLAEIRAELGDDRIGFEYGPGD